MILQHDFIMQFLEINFSQDRENINQILHEIFYTVIIIIQFWCRTFWWFFKLQNFNFTSCSVVSCSCACLCSQDLAAALTEPLRQNKADQQGRIDVYLPN
jgi:hypothetical protein